MTEKKQSIKITENPLAGGTFLNWIRLLRENDGIESKYMLRVIYVTFMTVLFSPVRLIQKVIFGKKIQNTEIRADPVFIIGHYRSGTTFLLNLMTQDRQWGFISTTQALLPDMFLLGKPIRNIFNLFLHEKRPMDNILVSPESPEEPEHAIGNLSPYSFYHGFCFPKRMMAYFNKYVLFQNVTSKEINTWKDVYRSILKAATYASKGKRLIIKNPPDTARLKTILEMFPHAKFIFLYRNPYVMFPSIKNFYSAYIKDWQFQDVDDAEFCENIFSIYEKMMDNYQLDKKLIPDGNLIEIKFEEFEKRPIELLEHIYKTLNIAGFEEAKASFLAYADSQKKYQKNKYSLTAEQVKQITDRWKMDIERWNYTVEEAVKVVL